MSLAEAAALCPAAKIIAFNPAFNQHALSKLAIWASRFSPRVIIDPTPCQVDGGFLPAPHGLLLDIAGVGHLFGSSKLLVENLLAALRRHGFTARASAAPTVGAAWALAHYGPDTTMLIGDGQLHAALTHLPLAALRLPQKTLRDIASVGVEKIHQLMELPRTGLLQRYGPELLLRLDQAFGRTHESIDPIYIQPPLAVEQLFDGPVKELEVIVSATENLLMQLTQKLRDGFEGTSELEVKLIRHGHAPAVKKIILGKPSHEARHLWAVLRPQIERLNLGNGIEAILLTAIRVDTMLPRQDAMHEAAHQQSHDQWLQELLDSLTNRWGGQRIFVPVPVASHRPENACRFQPVTHSAAIPLDFNDQEPGIPQLDRPSVLLENPERAHGVALAPDHPPYQFTWRGKSHIVVTHIGPERILTHRTAQHQQTRDYFKLQLEDGRWLWVYRHLEDGQWFVHGLWA